MLQDDTRGDYKMFQKQYLTVNETAELLCISRQTLYRYLKSNNGFPKPIHLTEKKIVFKSDEINSWVIEKRSNELSFA